MERVRLVAAVVGTVGVAGASARGVPPVYAIRTIGVSGAEYAYSGNAASFAMEINTVGPQGYVGGTTSRYTGNTGRGKDAWIFDGTTSRLIDITGPAYLEGGFLPLYRSATVVGINAQGRAVGRIARHTSNGSVSQGEDAWYWNGTSASIIGLTGPGYDQDPSSATTRRSNSPVSINRAGWVCGGTVRYGGGNVAGMEAWLFDGTSARAIGPSGPGYDYVMTGNVTHWINAAAMNNSGTVVGNASRYTAAAVSLGADGWIVSGNTLSIIAMTGGEYDRVTGSGTGHATWPQFINDAGQIAGWVFRYNAAGTSLGNGAFLWTNGAFQIVDPTSGIYTKAVATGGLQRNPTVRALGPTGVVVGESTRFDAAGNENGTDVWVYDGVQTRIIGLSGPQYQTPSNVPENQARKRSAFVGMNAAGQITGWTASGNVSYTVANGWVYDIATGVTTAIVPPPDSGAVTPSAILANGVVMGQYIVNRYPDGTGGYGKSFLWSATEGFQELQALAGPGEGVQPWSVLTTASGGIAGAADVWPSVVAGYGSKTGVPGVFAYSMVPVAQPGAFSLVAPADAVSIGSLRPTLEWTPSAGAESYTVYITRDGSATVSFTTTGTSAPVPAGMLSRCQHYTWSVKAGVMGVQTGATPALRGFSVTSRGDFNENGTVEVADIFAFLDAWFAGAGSADFDGLNGITIADIFAFLDAWFAGCPG
jgi:hypothetical protein